MRNGGRVLLSLCVLVLSTGSAQEATRVPLRVTGLPADAPLAVSTEQDGLVLRFRVSLRDGWHLYERDVGGGKPVTVTIVGGDYAAAGPLAVPKREDGLIVGEAELTLPLRRTGAGNALLATMGFMVCDALQCLPPIELRIEGDGGAGEAGTPVRVLLVGVDDLERTKRIAEFLRGRAFEVDVTIYALVTAELCDGHDVVIADSPTFGQVRGKKIDVKRFPLTASPLIAVGFLGTRILEEQKVTMACGYI